MEAKVESSSIYFLPYKESGGIQVTISWECPEADACALRSLQCGSPCSHKELGMMALCYAMVQGLESALMGNPKTAQKNRISSTRYGVTDGSFSFTYAAKGSKTVLARTLKACFRVLKPAKYSSAAAMALRNVGQSVSKEEKNYLIDALQTSLSKGLTVFVTGAMSAKTGHEVLKACLQNGVDVLPKRKEVGKKEAFSPKEVEMPADNNIQYKASGMDVVYLYSYLHTKLGVDPERTNSGLAVPKIGDAKVKSLRKKKTVDAFVDSKFGSIANLTGSICYFAAMTGLVSANVMAKASKGITIDSIKSELANVL